MELNNTYYILRHGEAISNTKGIFSSWPETFENPLTTEGVKQIEEAARKLKEKHIDMIFSSDVLRAKQTAEIIGKELGITPMFDERLREISFGDFNGKAAEELFYITLEDQSTKKDFAGGENYDDVLKRMNGFLMETNEKYKGKHILIVSHQCPLWILENDVKGFSLDHGMKFVPKEERIGRGEIRELR